MAFNSIAYLYFLLIAAVGFQFLPFRLKMLWLVLCSYYFYAQWNHAYLILIVASTLLDYTLALAIQKKPQNKKGFLWISILANLGVLFTFKYYEFFSDIALTLSQLLDRPLYLPVLELLLPVGISFYTFQTMSYTIDVYRGKIEAEKNFLRFAAYVSCFPQLVAGPIERASHLLPQMRSFQFLTYDNLCSGLRLIIWGLFKKVVIADRLAVYVETMFHEHTNPSNWQLLTAGILANILIYADFSAYADIAIGSARLLGINLRANFYFPLFSTSMPDFWRRWHISLHKWFLDYVYWPLGGSNVTWSRWMFNICIIFLLSGLWHGANWNFVIWSIFHLCLVLIHIHVIKFWDRMGWPYFKGKLSKLCFIILVQLQRGLSMILFFITDMDKNLRIFKSFFTESWALQTRAIFPGALFITIILITGISFLFWAEYLHLKRPWPERFKTMSTWRRYISYYIIALTLMTFGVETNNPFIYFQF